MSIMVRLKYRAVYEYDDIVLANYNELRVFPRREEWQKPLIRELKTDPPGKAVFFKDRYGNPTARITINTPHRQVTFIAISKVKLDMYKVEPTSNPRIPLNSDNLAPEVMIFLLPSKLVDPERLSGLAESILEGEAHLREAVVALTDWVYKRIEYVRGYTTVRTMAHEVVEIGKGVCQDKAHLLIGLLRAIGVPARYVSGALTDTPGETHAWVEVYWPGEGWVPLDPTHNRVFDLGYYYVKFAHGRDYSDVPPINGYYISRAPGKIREIRVEPKIVGK